MKQWDYGKRSGDGVLFYMDGEYCLKTRTKRWQSHSIPNGTGIGWAAIESEGRQYVLYHRGYPWGIQQS